VKITYTKKNSPLPKASLWENPSLKKRGTLKIAKILPFSLQEKGLGDEFKCLTSIFHTTTEGRRIEL
jgi:hypothetical protein